MINFKEIKSVNQLDKLLTDKKNILDGVRFAIPPSKIKNLSVMINKISRKYKNMSFNINLMYLSKWIHDERVLKNVLSNVSKNIETLFC